MTSSALAEERRSRRPCDFIHALGFGELPRQVVDRAERLLLDRIGVAASGTTTALSRIIRDHAAAHFAAATSLVESADYNDRFPVERGAHVTVRLAEGRSCTSAPVTARGDRTPVDDGTLLRTFRQLAEPVLGAARATRIEDAAIGLRNSGERGVRMLLEELTAESRRGGGA